MEMLMLNKAMMYLRFIGGLKNFLKDTYSLEHCQQIIKSRLGKRSENLLLIARRVIYGNEKSPYLKLLRMAGCEYDDFSRMVKQDGIEQALETISRMGVYFTIKEFKCQQAVRRGSSVFHFKETDFDNPYLKAHFVASSGGSRSRGTRSLIEFDFLKDKYVVPLTMKLHAYDLLDMPLGVWLPILPGAGPVSIMAALNGGKTTDRWFSPVEKSDFKPSLKNRMATNYLVYASRLFGKKLPSPEFVSFDDAVIIARWMASCIAAQGGCSITTYPTGAIKICQAANYNRLDIKGAKFIVSGEPITEAKQKVINSAGATCYPGYIASEIGVIAQACAYPSYSDDMHILSDTTCIIQHPHEVEHAGVTVDAFLFSSLLSSAPKILLNVESGDYGVIEKRSCGCLFEQAGCTEHIHHVRSFDKLTSAGMNFNGSDLLRLIEVVLPQKYGGVATDYQMVEEEGTDGQTRFSILVSPEVGKIDEAELLHTILKELGDGKDAKRLMAKIWQETNTLRLKRERPLTTGAGKLLPLHIRKNGNGEK